MNPPKELQNTDKVLWDSKDGIQTVFVNERESIGISVAGRVTVMPPREWLSSLDELERYRIELGYARARISKLESHIVDKVLLEHGYKL